MATIEEQLTQLDTTKQAIKTAIVNKGVAMDNVPFTEYAGKIGEIQSGGGAAPTINLSYGQTPPEDTTKNWIQCNTPTAVSFEMTDSTALNVTDADDKYKKGVNIYIDENYIYTVYADEEDYTGAYLIKTDRNTGEETGRVLIAPYKASATMDEKHIDAKMFSCATHLAILVESYAYNLPAVNVKPTYYVDIVQYNLSTGEMSSIISTSYTTANSYYTAYDLISINAETGYPIYYSYRYSNSSYSTTLCFNDAVSVSTSSQIQANSLYGALYYDDKLYFWSSSKMYYYDVTIGVITQLENPPANLLRLNHGYYYQNENKIYYSYYNTFELSCWDILTNQIVTVVELSNENISTKTVRWYSDDSLICFNENVAYVVTLKYLVENGTLNLAIKNGASLLVDSETLKLYATPRYGYYGGADGTGVRVKAYHYNGAEWVDNYDNSVYTTE